MKQDSLGLLRLQKAMEQDPENLILQSDSPNTLSKGKFEDAINAYEAVCQESQQYGCAARVGAALSAAEELQDDAQYRGAVWRPEKVRAAVYTSPRCVSMR